MFVQCASPDKAFKNVVSIAPEDSLAESDFASDKKPFYQSYAQFRPGAPSQDKL